MEKKATPVHSTSMYLFHLTHARYLLAPWAFDFAISELDQSHWRLEKKEASLAFFLVVQALKVPSV